MKQVQLKACPRCRGDMVLEEWLGEADVVCLQCGHRVPARAPQRPVELAAAVKDAA